MISGCLYSFEGECFRPIIQVVSSNCYKKGEVFSSIAHYQKPYSIGKTDQQQRWKDAVSCGSKYGDQELHYINKTGKYKEFQSCMERKGYYRYWPAECGYQDPKWDKGKCNL